MIEKEKYQQQILFEEQEVKVADEGNLPLVEQVVVDNDDWQAVEDADDELFAQQATEKSSGWGWKVFSTLLIGIIGFELYDFFLQGIINSPLLTSLYGILFVVIGIFTGSAVLKEFRGLRQLKSRESLREELTILAESSSHDKAADLLEKVTSGLANDLSAEQLQGWQETINKEYGDDELIALYSRQVLNETDQKALAEVARFSSESVVLVALSPVALLDMMIMLWRNLTLVDKIAGLYGLKLGYWSRIKLVKQVITNMIYAGASEVVADVSVDMLGADLLGKLSGRLAQGLGAGMLTARLGLKTIYMCRPVPFDDNAPRLSEVRKEVVGQIKRLVNKA